MTIFKVLFLGDVFADPGRQALVKILPQIRTSWGLNFIVANVENAVNGKGITPKVVDEFLKAGVDAMTGGNHILDADSIYPYLNSPDARVIRPYNLPRACPGKGARVFMAPNGTRVGVINLMGTVFMQPPVNLPLDAIDDALLDIKDDCDLILVDFHAEVTSEKRALGYYLDGKVQLVVGTHTHVPTADEQIFPQGMGYITDLGFCGAQDSVLGVSPAFVIHKMRTAVYKRRDNATEDVCLCGVVANIDMNTKRVQHIERVKLKLQDYL